jgi:hypothetical protein
MDYRRIALAAIVAWLVNSVYGVIMWIAVLGDGFASYPAVFRPQETMNANVPIMLGAGLIAMFALAFIYAKGYEGGSGVLEGIRFGLLLAIFTVCFVSIPMFTMLNISPQLGAMSSVTCFFEMVLIGVIIGSLYRRGDQRAAARAASADRFA